MATTTRKAILSTKTAAAKPSSTPSKPAKASASKTVPKKQTNAPASRSAGASVQSPAPSPAKAAVKPPSKASVGEPSKVSAAPAGPGKADLKLVRDSFTMPAVDIARIDQLKRRTLALGRATKKSELLRAGLHALQALSDAQLTAVLSGLAILKTGRPKKSS